jgi:hypothetical protein
MVSGMTPVGITQNERFLSCDTINLGVRYDGQFAVKRPWRRKDNFYGTISRLS